MAAKATQQVIDEFVGASHGDLARVEELTELYPAVIHTTSSWGETPMGAAAHCGNVPIVRFLLARGVGLEIFAATVLDMRDQVEWFLDDDPTLVNAPGAHAIPLLSHAVAAGHAEIVHLILTRGGDVNAGKTSHTPLHAAAFFGQTAIAERLIAAGADLNATDHRDRTPLQIAEESDQTEIAELLRRHGAK